MADATKKKTPVPKVVTKTTGSVVSVIQSPAMKAQGIKAVAVSPAIPPMPLPLQHSWYIQLDQLVGIFSGATIDIAWEAFELQFGIVGNELEATVIPVS